MGTILFFLVVGVIVAGVLVSRALEHKRAARIAAWYVDPYDHEDDIIELDDRDLWLATLPPPPPAAAFHHHVHAH